MYRNDGWAWFWMVPMMWLWVLVLGAVVYAAVRLASYVLPAVQVVVR